MDLHRMALYGSMLELTGGICSLIKHDARTGVPSLFRSFLEAAVELRNLMADPDYVDNMDACHKEQWLKVLKEAKTGKNPYLTSIAQLPGLDTHIATEESVLQKLCAAGRGPLNVFERFRRANMTEEYRSLYNFLSCDAHSNIRALISRHIEFRASDFDVVYYKDEPVDSFTSILDSTAGLLLQASLALHEAYMSEKSTEVRDMLFELENVRANYVA